MRGSQAIQRDDERSARCLLQVAVAGTLWIVLAGVPLHFVYSSTGLRWLAWLGPVNESVWEHFKLALWPTLLYTVVEWRLLPTYRRSLWTAKLACLVVVPVVITVAFYSYSAALGHSVLAIDIATFVVAVGAGQWAGYRIASARAHLNLASIGIVAIVGLATWFSYAPPDLPIFQAQRTPEPSFHD